MPTWNGTQWVADPPQAPAQGPSAISALLASLTQQAPPQPGMTPGAPPTPPGGPGGPGGAPQIQVGDMTAPPVPQAPALDPSALMSPGAVKSEAGIGIGNKIRNFLAGQAPAGYDNLLTPEQQQRDKPGILESLLGWGIFAPLLGRAMYERNLGQDVNMGQLAEQIQANRTTMQNNARILQARQRMAQLFPVAPNASLGDLRNNLAQQYNYAVSQGDTEMANDIGARMNDVFKESAGATTPRTVAPGTALVGPKGFLLL